MLSEFDIMYMTQKSVKGKTIANYLASNTILGDMVEEVEYLDEAITNLEIDED